MARLQGALALLPIYGRLPSGSSEAVLLKHSAIWRLAMKAAQRRANEEVGKQAKPCTDAKIRELLANPAIAKSTRCALLVGWLTAARCGDVLKLRVTDIQLSPNKMSVTWTRGKTVAKRGAYTVHTAMPPELAYLLEEQLAAANTALFPTTTGVMMRVALRTVDGAYEQRSIRRGALQILASSGMPLETIILFSGHSTTKMLLRYLGYGRLAKAQANAMLQVATMVFDG